MLIAVATDDFMTITGHVGRCNGFLVYNIEDGQVISIEQRENNFTHHRLHPEDHDHGDNTHQASSHSSLAGGLRDCKCLIANAAGGRLVADLQNNGIDVVLTLARDAEQAALDYAKGDLKTDDDAVCSHH